ncbi:MAG: hypothetical protein ABSF29_11995 [Tepidisphaeraceae bacterium]|jgi:hypothetical protein
MTQSAIATAADYADAMLTARKAKHLLWIILVLMVCAQIVCFFVARYRVDPAAVNRATDILKYITGGIDFLGIVLSIVLCVVLLLLIVIMLVGRLIGVSRVVSAFLWSVVLTVLLFPWQAFLINQTFNSPELKIPGVLYNWAELAARARAHPIGAHADILFWGRFVGWPAATLIILLIIHANSQRGLRQALGEIPPKPFPRTQ